MSITVTGEGVTRTINVAGGTGPQGAQGAQGAAGIRTATLVVAASNATAAEIAGSDYQCDGTADNVQIAAAIAALVATGGSVLLSSGTFNIAAALSLRSRTTLRGQGKSTVVKLATNANCNAIQLASVNTELTTLADFVIDGNRDNQSAASETGRGIYFDNSTGVFTYVDARHVMKHLHVREVKGTGVYLKGTPGAANQNPAATVMLDVQVHRVTGSGIRLGSDDARLIACTVGRAGEHGFLLEPPSGNTTLENCKAYYCGDNYTGIDATVAGFRLGAGTAAVRVKFIGCEAQDNKGDGFQIGNASTDIDLLGCQADSNGQVAFPRYGLQVVSGSRINIIGGQYLDRNSGAARVQTYGMLIGAGATGQVLGASFNNNLSGAVLNNAGQATFPVLESLGFVTKKKGTGSIASGATTAVITHGLAATPTLVNISFLEQGTADYGRWWVSAVGATTFTLNVTVDPGVSNLDFGWEAKV